MFYFIKPEFSRGMVDKSGYNIRNGTYDTNDYEIFENWRASHAYILNTFQSNLRNRSRRKKITVAQRLQRGPTIFDKLRRQPTMKLSRMHDIAGCRVIFRDQKELLAFRKSLHLSRFKHELLSGDRYNYITNPKETGYRGIHDVYKYNVSSKSGIFWNDLRIEIQYRTIYQHAWATAVEIADVITVNRIKFDETNSEYKLFFKLSSEIIARAFERQKSCFSQLPNKELVARFEDIENKIHLIRTFSNLKLAKKSNDKFSKNTLLIFNFETPLNSTKLQIEYHDSIKRAILRYSELEKELKGKADIVLVKGDDEHAIRDAFRNYFTDTHDFVKYIREGSKILCDLG